MRILIVGLLTAAPVAGLPSASDAWAQAADHRFPIADCRASYSRTHHGYPASDIFARGGCAVVSVTDGVVDEVSRTDRWKPRVNAGATRGGLSVSVVGTDRVRYYYSHLSAISDAIAPGEPIRAGQRIGSVGTTGSARGTSPHLHFGLSWPTKKGVWWVRRGELPPAPYLDAWRSGRDLSPAPAIRKLREKRGAAPRCSAEC